MACNVLPVEINAWLYANRNAARESVDAVIMVFRSVNSPVNVKCGQTSKHALKGANAKEMGSVFRPVQLAPRKTGNVAVVAVRSDSAWVDNGPIGVNVGETLRLMNEHAASVVSSGESAQWMASGKIGDLVLGPRPAI